MSEWPTDERAITLRWNRRRYKITYRWRLYPNPQAYPAFEVLAIEPAPRPAVAQDVINFAGMLARSDQLRVQLARRREEVRSMIDKWTVVRDPAAQRAAVPLARGVYQRELLYGYHNLSGSTLKGKARKYAPHYARSRQALLARLSAAGIPWTERRGPHGRRVLVLG